MEDRAALEPHRASYKGADVRRLRGSLVAEQTLARIGAQRLWDDLQGATAVTALGTLTGNQAVQAARAGLRALYCSGWQVAADANLAGEMYPDQSLYPVEQRAGARRADQQRVGAPRPNRIARRTTAATHWYLPIVADAEAGFGGPLNVFELTKAMIARRRRPACTSKTSSARRKSAVILGGKVLIPTQQAVRHLIAARLAADVLDVPTIIIARTDANAAKLITSDVDPRDRELLTGERTPEGFYVYDAGLEACIARGLAYAPYADLIWMETSEPNLEEAQRFADAIHARFPGKLLAYNCSPSFNWKKKLDDPYDRGISASD